MTASKLTGLEEGEIAQDAVVAGHGLSQRNGASASASTAPIIFSDETRRSPPVHPARRVSSKGFTVSAQLANTAQALQQQEQEGGLFKEQQKPLYEPTSPPYGPDLIMSKSPKAPAASPMENQPPKTLFSYEENLECINV